MSYATSSLGVWRLVKLKLGTNERPFIFYMKMAAES